MTAGSSPPRTSRLVVGLARAVVPSVQRSHVVAVVAAGSRSRASVAAYLADAGFAVRTLRSIRSIPAGVSSVLWVCEAHDHLGPLLAALGRWLVGSARRALVVTCRPLAFRDAIQTHGRRLAVFPPSTFAWQLVDALRDDVRRSPRHEVAE